MAIQKEQTNPATNTIYEVSKKEIRDYYIVFLCISVCIGLLFYRSISAIVFFFLCSFLFENKYKKYIKNQKKKKLTLGFSDFLYSLSSSLSAGRQLPQAIADANRSIEVLWGSDSLIGRQIGNICINLGALNKRPEDLFDDLAEKSEIEEILLFSESLEICRQKGGKLEEVCLKSGYMIIEKIELMQEIDSILSEKKLDIIIMSAMPFLVLYLVSSGSSGYLDVLYETSAGKLIMTVSLLLIVLAILWSLRILKSAN